MPDKEQIFLKDINETGFYCAVDDTERLYIYEVINNVSQEWIKKDPKAKLLIDQWIYDYTDYDDRKVYSTSGNLEATYCNISTCKFYKIEDTKFKIFGNCGQFLVEDKPTYKEQLARKTKEYEELLVKVNQYSNILEEIKKISYYGTFKCCDCAGFDCKYCTEEQFKIIFNLINDVLDKYKKE